jgi:hypothetical protein
MLFLIGQQNGSAKAKPLSMHNKSLIPTRCRGATQVVMIPALAPAKALHGDPSASYQSPASSDPRRLAIIDPKDRAHVPHAKA